MGFSTDLAPQPAIWLGNIKVEEPVTTLSDLLVSAVCFYAFFGLRQHGKSGMVNLLFQYFFLFMGLATAIGGIIGHGFLYAFSFHWKLPGWLTSMVAVTLAERAVILRSRPYLSPRFFVFFSWLNIVELLTFMVLSFSTLNFLFVEIHSAYGLLGVVGGFSIFLYRKTGTPATKKFLYAVGLAGLAAFFFTSRLGLSPWFNHIDISHTFMAISTYLFYWGALQLDDKY